MKLKFKHKMIFLFLFLMFNNLNKMMFFSTLLMSTLMSISSTSWFGGWLGLEINMLSFIPLILNNKNMMSTEASLKYFLTQTIASSILLFSSILMPIYNEYIMNFPPMTNETINMMILSSLMMKSGTAPFHFWFPTVMEGLKWNKCLMLMTWQKIAPLMMISYCLKNINIFMIIISLSVFIGALGGLNQTSMRKLMAFSSINHLGWMISNLLISEMIFNFYMLMYSLMSMSIIFLMNMFNILHINQSFSFNNNNNIIKFSMYSMLLSLGGLPPFWGFLPKWISIQLLINNNFIFISFIMIMMTLITLYYYIRISFSAFMLNYSEPKWNFWFNYNNFNLKMTLILTFLSIISLSLCTMLIMIM
uniref:NADH-ubiquinone oxidoreductase chain 2 n=1 Tax=Pleroneura sp. 1 GYN-2021b TaxID=2899767 RepID=A0A9E8YAZ6_9HYME|nr:NADH dehydrogenase subunit 2 [Pleroneura sp. 1 GYN-2021b]